MMNDGQWPGAAVNIAQPPWENIVHEACLPGLPAVTHVKPQQAQ